MNTNKLIGMLLYTISIVTLTINLNGCNIRLPQPEQYHYEERYVNAPAEKANEQINQYCTQGFSVDSDGLSYSHQGEYGLNLWISAHLKKKIIDKPSK